MEMGRVLADLGVRPGLLSLAEREALEIDRFVEAS